MRSPNNQPLLTVAKSRSLQFLILLLIAEMALIAATWPLWFSDAAFPAVALVPGLDSMPSVVSPLLSTGLLLSCLYAIGSAARQLFKSQLNAHDTPHRIGPHEPSAGSCLIVCRAPLIVAIVLAGVLALTNQHRLQPWHWLLLLLLVQFVTLTGVQRTRVQRLTIASIYVFAALSRIGPAIDSGMSPQVLKTLLDLLDLTGMSNIASSPRAIFVGCSAMSCVEGLVGLGLLWSRSRRVAILAAVVIHLLLLLALSPIGLNHNAGVLIWNVFLLLALPLLFWHTVTPGDAAGANAAGRKLLMAECGLVVLFPLASLFGFADNWPGWQLYSPRPDVVRLYVSNTVAESLPTDCQPFIGTPLPLQDLRPVRLDWWSLNATGAPLYPEDRFQLAVINKLLPPDVSQGIRIVVDTAEFPDFWHRKQIDITSRKQLLAAIDGNRLP